MNTRFSKSIFYRPMFVLSIIAVTLLVTASIATWRVAAQETNPHFTVFPEWEWFDGNDWPDGATVSITVAGKSECDTTKESWGGFFNGGFGEGCDVVTGDEVTFTDGTTTRIHVVQNLSITAVDKAANKVTGTAYDGAWIHAWVHELGGDLYLQSVGGYWAADFGQAGIDLQELMSGRVEIQDESGNSTAVDWNIPNPYFTVFPEWEWFDGMDWPDGILVKITVDGKEQCTTEGYSTGMFFNGGFPEGCDVTTGDIIIFDDGETIRTHTIRNLVITKIDKMANTVAGIADAGARLSVWAHEREGALDVFAGDDGSWLADFDDIGIDLVENMGGRAKIDDEMGNATAVDWSIPNPYFTVFPEWEWFDGMDWQGEGSVTITVDGKPECGTNIESPGSFFNGSFGESCDIEFGDVVTFTGSETVRTHVVRKLIITDVNVEANTISGKAHTGDVVYVWPHSTGQQVEAVVDKKGSWQVDFTGQYDLVFGDGGRAEIRDDAGNATAVDWYTVNPRFTVYPDAQWFDGIDWPDGSIVTINVAGKPECYLERESWGGFFNGGFPEGCLVSTGDKVFFTDGTTMRKHTVHNLAIKVIDKEANTVSGVADSGEHVYIWAWYMDGTTVEGSNTEATVENGTWFVDYEALRVNLELGMGIQAEIRDADGNATSVDLPVPDPRIVASITENWFFLVDFIPGSALDLSIYDSQNNLVWQDALLTTDVNGFAWINADIHNIDLEPGHSLVVSDGTTTKNLVIEGFTFDVFDTSLGRLEGTAPEPFGRRVWVGIGWESEGWSTDVYTDEAGNWAADYGGPIPAGFLWVAAQIYDQDGDASELRPSPRSIMAGNFSIAWSLANPEDILYLSWNGSGNLTNAWKPDFCPGDFEFYGNSWVSENEGTVQFFFDSLVGCDMGGDWSQNEATIDISSISWANIPVHTTYQFNEETPNLIEVNREFVFGDAYTHDIRPFIPRLYPFNRFSDVLHPNINGTELMNDATCDFGCQLTNWNGAWFAIHDPVTGTGMIVIHQPSDYGVALWLDNDGGSYTNATSVLLLQPSEGFTGTVKETEYLCFYDSSTWTPNLETLPAGCQP